MDGPEIADLLKPQKYSSETSKKFDDDLAEFLMRPLSPNTPILLRAKEPENVLSGSAVQTINGKTGGKVQKLNQDNYFAYQEIMSSQSQHLIGVCDGHGSAGRQCSLYVKNYIYSHFQKHLKNYILEETKDTLRRDGKFVDFDL